MKSWLSSDARAALLVLALAPACGGEKGGNTDSDGSSSGTGSSSGEASSGVSATSGAVFTSTDGLTSDASTSTGVTTGDTADTASDSSSGTTGEPAIMCGGEDPYFPEPDRSCMIDDDCSTLDHQIDCCGSLVVWGINGETSKEFGALELECQNQYPECECAAMPPTADDGKTVDDATLVKVACTDGECKTFVP